MRSLHTLALDILLFCLRSGIFSKKILIFIFSVSGNVLYWLGRRLFRRLLIRAYKLHLKLQSRLERLGIKITNPFFYFFSSNTLAYILIIGIAGTVAITNIHAKETAPDILNPRNILSRIVSLDNDQEIIEETNSHLAGQYSPLTGVQFQSSTDPAQGAPTPDQQRQLSNGQIAMNPGALIKPILPTTQQQVREPSATQTYTIQEGDTISEIATRFGLKTSTLLAANNLTLLSPLRIGGRLLILPRDGINYRVQRGDTLEKIAHQFQTTVDKIMATNSLSSDQLALGVNLLIPDAVMPPAGSLAQASAKPTLLGRIKNLLNPRIAAPTITRGVAGALSMAWPTTARRITQYFSWNHHGVDIAGPPSNKIFAAGDGVVTISGWQKGYGNTILINHGNGKVTRYGHASKLLVRAGEHVAKGETIAMVGSTGRSTGPHLHFEIHVNGRSVNPFAYVR